MLAFSHHILLAEDDPDLRGLVARALHDDGHVVTEVANGADALDYLGHCYDTGAELPDLVITEMRMPTLSGLHLLATISRMRDPVPVIAIGEVALHAGATRLGARATLTRPLDLHALRAEVERSVSRSLVRDLVRPLSPSELEVRAGARSLSRAGAREHVERIARSASFMDRLVGEGILQLPRRVEHRATELASDPRGVMLEIRDTVTVSLDDQRIEHMLGNVIASAVDSAPAGASLEVRVERSGSSIRLSVIDEGPGLTPEDARSVLELVGLS